MDPIHEICERLRKYHELEIIQDDDWLAARACVPDGFDAAFQDNGEEYTVYVDEAWHRHFEKSEVDCAIRCFLFLLSDQCRLNVFSRGGKKYKWVLESRETGDWTAYGEASSLWSAFWRPPDVCCLQNRVLKGKEL